MQCDILQNVSFNSVVAVKDHMSQSNKTILYTVLENPKNQMLKSLLGDFYYR